MTSTQYKVGSAHYNQDILTDCIRLLSLKEHICEDSEIHMCSITDFRNNKRFNLVIHDKTPPELIILDYHHFSDYKFQTVMMNTFVGNLKVWFDSEKLSPLCRIVVPFSKPLLQSFYEEVDMDKYDVSYISMNDLDYKNHPLLMASISNECTKLLNDVGLQALVPYEPIHKTFDSLKKVWSSGTVTVDALVKHATSGGKEVSDDTILFVEFIPKPEEKINNNDVVTKYLSSYQCSIIRNHIINVIKGGCCNKMVPSVVNGYKIPPSFSVMHALSDGFSIVMFSNTHNNQKKLYTIHQSMGIRLILKYGMTLVWNGFLLHCGAKSRTTKDGTHLMDTRWFNYYWTCSDLTQPRSRQSPREDGTNLNRKGLNTCKSFRSLLHGKICQACTEDIVLDLSDNDINGIEPGTVICGDLTNLGWSVIKSVPIPREVLHTIFDVKKNGKWQKMEPNSLRRQKFNINSKCKQVNDWMTDVGIQYYVAEVKKLIIDRHLPVGHNYDVGKRNLLSNLGPISDDQ